MGSKVPSGGCTVRERDDKYLCMGMKMLGYVLDEFQRPKLICKISFYKLLVHSYMGREISFKYPGMEQVFSATYTRNKSKQN